MNTETFWKFIDDLGLDILKAIGYKVYYCPYCKTCFRNSYYNLMQHIFFSCNRSLRNIYKKPYYQTIMKEQLNWNIKPLSFIFYKNK